MPCIDKIQRSLLCNKIIKGAVIELFFDERHILMNLPYFEAHQFLINNTLTFTLKNTVGIIIRLLLFFNKK